jgi:hypothetical protein
VYFIYRHTSMDPTSHSSDGQGFIPSKSPSVSISTGDYNIVTRLVSRSLTGRGLQIQVHQHYGFRLHLVWGSDARERCLERKCVTYEKLQAFCDRLLRSGLEEVCTCTCTCVGAALSDRYKVIPFRRVHVPNPADDDLDVWSTKLWEELLKQPKCCCKVSSTAPVVNPRHRIARNKYLLFV